MKVLQIANYKQGTGGISGQVEKIHACLDAEGIESAIFSVKGSAWYRIKAFFRLIAKGCSYDVFHVHTCSHGGFISAVMGISVGRLLRRRVVLTYHGGSADYYIGKHQRMVRFFLKRTDVNIVLSGFVAKAFDKYGIPYQIIPNIIELDGSRFHERETINPNFISIRTLSPLYNIGCIIRAFQIIKSRFPQASLTIVGGGPSREALEKMVNDLQLKDVRFTGRVDNTQIYEYLNGADVMLSSPVVDNMPVSVLEGMNAGLLVISSKVGGIPYMIDDGVNGLLFPSKNHEKLAEKMIMAVENQEKSKAMIREANQGLGMYSWESVKQKLLPVYAGNK